MVHVVPYMHPHAGGPVILVDQLAREQVRRGHVVTVITTSLLFTGDPQLDRSIFDDAPYKTVVVNPNANRVVGSGVVDRWVPEIERAEIVHTHTIWSGLIRGAVRVAQACGRPYVMMPHGMLDPHAMAVRRWRKRLYLTLVEQRSLRKASAILFTTERERVLAAQTCPAIQKLGYRITVPGAEALPNERHEALGEQFRKRYCFRKGDRIWLFLGRVHPKKGVGAMLQSFDRTTRGSAIQLAIAGHGEARYTMQMRELAAGLDCADRVHFLGHLSGDDKWGAFAAAEAFLLPSHQENFGLVVAEAMHMALPVLVSNRVNSAEHVVSASAGLVYDFDERGGLDHAMSKLVDCAVEQLTAYGTQGQEYARRHLTWAACAESTQRAYRSALARAAGCGRATT